MMNKIILIMLIMLTVSGCGGEAKDSATPMQSSEVQTNMNTNADMKQINKIKMQIENHTFDIILEDNPTTAMLIKKLPLQIEMQELNGNEKYYKFNETFPTADNNPGKIHVGDVMLFNGSYLVIFYKEFTSSYSYTRLGRIENIDNLTELVGDKNINVLITN